MENNNIILSEEELDNVTGGIYDVDAEKWKEQAAAEGRNILYEPNTGYAKCGFCHMSKSIYAREKWDIKYGFDEYRDCKCYSCGRELGNFNTAGFAVS